MARGLLIAAPASGSGKTTVTLGLLRRLRQEGTAAASVKVGPDYIDPAFHAAASGRPCHNLDSWAMRGATLAGLVAAAGEGCEIVIGEGVMGLFDGAPGGAGSTAELAARTGWPVVLVVDAAGMGASAAALVEGFLGHRDDVEIAGLIFNRVGSPRHAELLANAVRPLGLPVLGCLPKQEGLKLPSRHLGLVQAGEHAALEDFLETAAASIADHLDCRRLCDLARPSRLTPGPPVVVLPPLGQRIAVARDTAFAFAYDFVLAGWRAAGAELSFFSPLADEGPGPGSDAIYLPGGYPELEAGRLAANRGFLGGLRAAAANGAAIYGECGGYMVLGEGLVDAAGTRHAMAGLLPHGCSFAARRLSLGYRRIELLADTALGAAGTCFRGHEFHYATLEDGSAGDAWLQASDSEGNCLGDLGTRQGRAFGSFLHLIDREDGPAAAAAAPARSTG